MMTCQHFFHCQFCRRFGKVGAAMKKLYFFGFILSLHTQDQTTYVHISNGEVEEHLEIVGGECENFLKYYVQTFLCK